MASSDKFILCLTGISSPVPIVCIIREPLKCAPFFASRFPCWPSSGAYLKVPSGASAPSSASATSKSRPPSLSPLRRSHALAEQAPLEAQAQEWEDALERLRAQEEPPSAPDSLLTTPNPSTASKRPIPSAPNVPAAASSLRSPRNHKTDRRQAILNPLRNPANTLQFRFSILNSNSVPQRLHHLSYPRAVPPFHPLFPYSQPAHLKSTGETGINLTTVSPFLRPPTKKPRAMPGAGV